MPSVLLCHMLEITVQYFYAYLKSGSILFAECPALYYFLQRHFPSTPLLSLEAEWLRNIK